MAAAFAADGQHLLLAAETGWLLLHAPLWEVCRPAHVRMDLRAHAILIVITASLKPAVFDKLLTVILMWERCAGHHTMSTLSAMAPLPTWGQSG